MDMTMRIVIVNAQLPLATRELALTAFMRSNDLLGRHWKAFLGFDPRSSARLPAETSSG